MERKEEPEELRCLCGSLMARILSGQLELKCKRCKRIHRIPLVKSASEGNAATT